VNTFCILDFEGHTLGCGLYLGASIFDHSCEPMAIASFVSTKISIRTIQDIPVELPVRASTTFPTYMIVFSACVRMVYVMIFVFL